MYKKYLIVALLGFMVITAISFIQEKNSYEENYVKQISLFENQQAILVNLIKDKDLSSPQNIGMMKEEIFLARAKMKALDFWFRYLEPISYKKINGPLPVEWETEVFEKFEKPYKREAAGLTLALLYLEEPDSKKDSLLRLIELSRTASKLYSKDSITSELETYHHFFLCNRLFLLNLSAIYTTGFECPDTTKIIPELQMMLSEVATIYTTFNESFPETVLSMEYLRLYGNALKFVSNQSPIYSTFDHFTFLKEYVNPLFSLNQQFILQYKVVSKSNVDYSLNKKSSSIFSKTLYNAQNSKGVFIRVKDEEVLAEINAIGKLLFYDPILSGNNLRSCASCHKPTEYFTDTSKLRSLQFNKKDFLDRNTPSLINANYNHLLMLDGKHISLQNQTKDVISTAIEMGSKEKEVVEKVLSCKEYKRAFDKFLKYTPQEKEITIDHITSAITLYYTKFSNYSAPFDEAMNNRIQVEPVVKEGFNLFMSKAQCATCHFVPQFNGVKPPYTNSEFEVIGVPASDNPKKLSADKGRYNINPAEETLNAFRTGSIRNAEFTSPYMHNGSFKTLHQVVNFYNEGGGVGKGFDVPNQTLTADSLKLTKVEIDKIVLFVKSLNERIPFEKPPLELPMSKDKKLNTRKVGGEY